ncbi:DUF3089 domain-containing protein [Sphingomonas sp. UV9]|uniref:DUF3089 domain-containing protein n=1 Tax=Sphingomonas sp. UV9 TaxID=1851410 RepID=UPI000FFC636D|nr:DUF3089 domain-containing protein [Sphingomonas sp. UV9]RXD04871.1 DUF3089 domain-containing protein [Sphingomonas sp. UV9]
MTVAWRSAPKRRWIRLGFGCFGAVVVLLLATFTAIGGWGFVVSMRGPATPFAASTPPPAPDYAARAAWLAFPGRDGLERSTPPGMRAVDERAAPADVFFVHPTTFSGSPVWNARFDASDTAAPLYPAVLLGQVSAFNGCCRLYAPRYRQATLAALKTPAAMEIAYGDIARAFRNYVAHQNHGRPFIIASHSQGTAHAIRLLQEEILKTPLKRQLVAAYLIGGYVPDTLRAVGLPVCDDARQTGCVLSYNTSETGRSGARMIVDGKTYWWRGALVVDGKPDAVCVNPLTGRRAGAAQAEANPGSLPFPTAPFGHAAKSLPPLTRHLTGAVCRASLLEVDVPWSETSAFSDKLSLIFGSYHLNDYGMFYGALRRDAVDRVAAWQAANDVR